MCGYSAKEEKRHGQKKKIKGPKKLIESAAFGYYKISGVVGSSGYCFKKYYTLRYAALLKDELNHGVTAPIIYKPKCSKGDVHRAL
jgi:hypothetical protein